MAVDIDRVFQATGQSSWQFLTTSGQGCYIPAYQRPFSWGSDNVDRLFEDAIHGLNLLRKRENTISFLGTVIAIHDTKHVTVQPIFKSEMPPKVMTIIDGQQRISTFIMINIAIHDLISKLLPKTSKRSEEHFQWLADQIETLTAALRQTFLIDMTTGDKDYNFYPRLIRSYEDVWSKRKVQAKYNSPVCKLIWEYHLYLTTAEKKPFKFDPLGQGGGRDKHYGAASDIFKHIRKRIKDITGKKWEENDFPELLDIAQTKSFSEAIWGYDIPNEVVDFVRDEIETPDYDSFAQLFRLLVFSKYLNDRMAFTVVTAENEDDAFDMFEALNTTGEPLTAFETFKPKVIESEGMANYETSSSFTYVKEIENYLENFKKAEEKQRATSEMLVPFALSETGEKVQKRLVDQRRYLREQFESEELTELEEKREFVRRLSDTSVFMKTVWKRPPNERISFTQGKVIDPATETGLNVVRDLNHHIVVAPLSRFFSELRRAKDEEVAEKEKMLVEAAQATVAFSILWRAAFGGAANIDSKYRSILSSKIDGKYGPLASRPKEYVGSVSILNYKKTLEYFLKDMKIGDKDSWVKAVARSPIYKQKIVARYLLFAASHDAAIDSTVPGLISGGRKGLLDLLTPEKWQDKDYLTVEHIAPQSNGGTWKNELYEDPDTVDKLGNLTLLPGSENSLVGNKRWEHKRALYRILSSETQQEFDTNKTECKSVGLSLSRNSEEILERSSYLPLCRSLGQKKDEWDLVFVEKRSTRLAELAWDQISAWLRD